MPCYPGALALLLGSAMAMGGFEIERATRVLSLVAACARSGDVKPVFSHPQPARTRRYSAFIAISRLGRLQALPWGTCKISPSLPSPIFECRCWWPHSPFRSVHSQPGSGLVSGRFSPCSDDDTFLPRRPHGHGCFRSLPVFASAGGGDPEITAGNPDCEITTITRFPLYSFTLTALRCCATDASTIWSMARTHPVRPMCSSTTRSSRIYGLSRSAPTLWPVKM